MKLQQITPYEFNEYERLHSRACKLEWMFCLEPKFMKYRIMVMDFISQEVYPTYRLDKSGEFLTPIYEDKNATPITFSELAARPGLLINILKEGYISKNDTVLVYHCETCKVWLVKDGIHRLSKWAVEGEKKEITVYQVSSKNWSHAQVDMPNYCKCG